MPTRCRPRNIPENFGKGDIRGVIAAESSNNSKEAGDYIPTLAFGIPGGTSTALILTALIAVGINPGPEMLTTQLNLTFAVVWTLTIANIIAVAICLAFIKPISRMCFMPFFSLVPMILVFVFIGAFAANRSSIDLIALLGFSFLGFTHAPSWLAAFTAGLGHGVGRQDGELSLAFLRPFRLRMVQPARL